LIKVSYRVRYYDLGSCGSNCGAGHLDPSLCRCVIHAPVWGMA
jgi:hypothetical protein